MVEAFDKEYPPEKATVGPAGPVGAAAIPDTPSGQHKDPNPYKEPSAWQKYLGGVETNASLMTGMTTGLAGGVLNSIKDIGRHALYRIAGEDPSQLPTLEQSFQEGARALTYEPRTEVGRENLDDLAKSEAMRLMTAAGPLRQTALLAQAAPRAVQQVGTAARATAEPFMPKGPPAARIEPSLKPRFKVVDGKIVKVEPEAIPSSEVTLDGTPAKADPLAGLDRAPPEVQKAINTAKQKGHLNIDAAKRHIEASTLDVPVRLSEGQALLDPRTISEEMNSRAGRGAKVSPEFYNQQPKALAQNLDSIRERAAPEVQSTNTTQHGQVLIDAAKAADAPERAAISGAYRALREAAGGDFPVDGQAFVANAEAALKKNLKTGAVPASIRSAMDEFKGGRQMTFEDFETLRTDLADVARSSPDGSARHAANIIRQSLEDLPLTAEAAELKPLADKARSMAKARFSKLEADPAYKAAVEDVAAIGEDSALADVFVNKYLVGGRRANIARFQENVPQAKQTVSAATVDHLRNVARADVEAGKFNAQTYNNTLEKLGPKFDVLVDPESAAKLKAVGNVAKYTTVQPKGSYVNNSNTLVGAAGDAGSALARSFLAVKTMGASEGVKSVIDSARASRAAKQSTAPGAGVSTKLSDVGKP